MTHEKAPPSSAASSTAPTRVPVVLIGCGAVAQQFYIPTFRAAVRDGAIEVAALVDPSTAARGLLARAFPKARQADTLEQVELPAGALAVIASPPRFHAAQTQAAFQCGWHVLCEKPMASSAAECAAMVAAAEAAQRLLAVGLYKRFFPSSRYLHSLVRQGHLGALRHFTVSEGGPFRWPAATPSFFNKTQTPGGVLLDIGVHVLDLLLWWFGEPERFQYADDAMGGLETNVHLTLQYTGGATGNVHLSRDWKTPNQYRFEFERGVVTWTTNDANGLTVQLKGLPAALHSQLVTPIEEVRPTAPLPLATNPQSFIYQLLNVVSAIRGQEPLLVDGREGMRSLTLIENCYRNRTLVEQPWLTATEAARAQHLASQP